MDELIAKAAAATGMPEALVQRSAAARASTEGRTIEDVLAEWAGVDAPAAGEAPATDAPAAEAPAPAEAPPAAPKPPATGVEKFVEAAAESMDVPASFVRKSADARARVEGRSFEEVLADWAEVDVAEIHAAAEEEQTAAVAKEEADAAAAEAAATAPAGDDADAAEGEAVEEPASVEVIGGDDEPYEPEDEEPELVGASSGVPRWLSSLFIIIPAFAIAYAAFFPNGPNCGDSGRLAVDPVTGLAVDCDGSEWGQDSIDFLAIGAAVFSSCQNCHGADGGGLAAGPAFTGGALEATFPPGECESHYDWVRLGTTGWPDATYGANNRTVGGFGVMPGFENTLSEEQLRAVVLFERVQFAGLDLEEALIDCGLVEGDDDESIEATEE